MFSNKQKLPCIESAPLPSTLLLEPLSAATTTPSVQALVDVIRSAESATSPSHRLSLSYLWREDQIGLVPYAKAEFVIANLQVTSYLCYIHLLCALSAKVIVTVCDYVRCITPNTLDAYGMLKHALMTRYTPPPQIDKCYKLLDMLPFGDCHPLTLHSDIQDPIPISWSTPFICTAYLRQ